MNYRKILGNLPYADMRFCTCFGDYVSDFGPDPFL